MPLASPSSLTSNTLATFLDHVPISTNNAEKWKPKQMGSNSSGDYWALSRALSAPLGTERWILHHLFLSTGTEVEGQKPIVAICLHVTKMPMAWGTWLWNATFFGILNSLQGFLQHNKYPLVQTLGLHHLWDSNEILLQIMLELWHANSAPYCGSSVLCCWLTQLSNTAVRTCLEVWLWPLSSVKTAAYRLSSDYAQALEAQGICVRRWLKVSLYN